MGLIRKKKSCKFSINLVCSLNLKKCGVWNVFPVSRKKNVLFMFSRTLLSFSFNQAEVSLFVTSRRAAAGVSCIYIFCRGVPINMKWAGVSCIYIFSTGCPNKHEVRDSKSSVFRVLILIRKSGLLKYILCKR